jgi:hypothetical protein
MEMFKEQTYVILVSKPLKQSLFSTYNELSVGCSSQLWDVWMVQTQNHVSFIFWIVQVFCMVCECCVSITIYLCDDKDLIPN